MHESDYQKIDMLRTYLITICIRMSIFTRNARRVICLATLNSVRIIATVEMDVGQ